MTQQGGNAQAANRIRAAWAPLMEGAQNVMARKGTERADEAIAGELQAIADKATAQGFHGIKVDPTPNEAYTLQGVTSGAATPETDAGAKAAAEAHAAKVSEQAEG